MKRNKKLQKITRKIRQLLAEGTSPQKLALTVATGSTIGLFPVVGVTSALCVGAAIPLRLNLVFIQVVNYMVYPIQLVLFIPYLKAGNHFFQLTQHPVNYQNLLHIVQTDTMAALGEFGYLLLSAILLWAVIALPLSFILYRSSLKYLKRVQVKI